MFDRLFHLFFPNRCIFCNAVIGAKGHCCDSCQELLPYAVGDRVCPRCGSDPCRCGQKLPAYDRAVSPFYYDLGAKNAILQLKFHGRKSYAKGLAAEMYKKLLLEGALPEQAVITAVPMLRKDEYARGYNQAELLAKHLSKLAKIPYQKLLIKQRGTKKQHELGFLERRKNLKNAFSLTEEGRRYLLEHSCDVILCDDVLTTGATLDECARVIREAFDPKECRKIIGCTAATTCRNSRIVIE